MATGSLSLKDTTELISGGREVKGSANQVITNWIKNFALLVKFGDYYKVSYYLLERAIFRIFSIDFSQIIDTLLGAD